jgi:hypothetical protein
MRRVLYACVAVLSLAACNASAPSGITESPALTPAQSQATAATPGPSPSASSAATPAPSLVVAVTPPPIVLTRTFTSVANRFSMRIQDNWQTAPAKHSGDEDTVLATGNDTSILVDVSPLKKGQTFAAWLNDFHDQTLKDTTIPPGCDGGDPSTWPAVMISHLRGVWQQMCNQVNAFVEVGGKVYQFTWHNDTFDNSQHLSVADFKTVLQTVRFS